MTAPTIQSPPVAPGAGWIDLPTAAKRSGRSIGHVRRLCGSAKYCPGGSTLLSKGQARLVAPAGGGKPEWWIKEDADPAFAPVKFANQIGTDVRHLTDRQRHTAQLRRLILDKWEEAVSAAFKLGFDRDAATGRFVQQLFLGEVPGLKQSIELSRRTLYYWQDRWQRGGLAGLADGRGGKGQGGEQPEDPFLEKVKSLYLHKNKPKLSTCYEMARYDAAEKGWAICSRRTAQRAVDSIRKDVLLMYRFGEKKAYTNEAEPFIERDYRTLRSNQIWNGDHHQFDVVVRVTKAGKIEHVRPWVTGWQDMRSRKIVGWRVFDGDPNSDTILGALDDGVRAHGIPEGACIDNGKDYDSYVLNGRTKKDRWLIRRGKIQLDEAHAAGVFAALGIKASFCWTYHGQSKPIERFFETVELHTRLWPTYCGNCPQDRPEDLQLLIERGKAPTLEDFRDWFATWLRDAYHSAPHTGDAMDGKSPAVVFEECLSLKRTAPAELLDVLLLKPTPPLKVHQNGVTWQGLRYGQYEPALRAMLGREVVLRVNPTEIGRVQVWTPAGKFVCLAPANAKLPADATAEELRKAVKEKLGERKKVKEYHQVRPRLAEDLPDKILRARVAANAGAKPADPDLPPPSLQPVRSPLEGELPRVQRAFEMGNLRQAVGAETSDPGGFLYGGGAASDDEDAPPSMSFRDMMVRPEEGDE